MPIANRREPHVLHRSAQAVSPWVRLETVSAVMPGESRAEIYHAIGQADYVNVLCLHENGNIVCVRQYRPILDVFTLEFPGGLRDGDEVPAETAKREIEEETGLSVRELIPLIESFADVGRLTNKLFGFFALVYGTPRSTEVGVEPSFVPCREIRETAASGAIDIPANIALLYLAGCHPRIRAICAKLGLGPPPWMAT